MKPASLLRYALAGVLSGLAPWATAAAAAADLLDSDPSNVRAASVYIQRLGSSSVSSRPAPAPALLAEIRYDVLDPATAQVVAYEPPSGEEDDENDDNDEAEEELYRIGLYDPQAKQWLGGTSVAAGSNFAKGYRPQFILTVMGPAVANDYVGVSVRGLAIDAGATRDFGPQALVVVAGKGATPVLNRPVVLSPEGKKAPVEEEKTFLQRYWWALALALVMVVTTGGGDEK